ncbi:hypothetical protein [Tepidibacter hydrothermalis]|uniref:Uncharacterized protein n=1 Tax=Tepidibacter hydrothermalis TaxID=3036126 RepID=A0ABY8EBG1_9FIRM|nr:hypothetical protein [Tepidibacter hydrothermalis]WFD09235.1 hypothetical protein P4S50_12665 [Tepidibacter hydrothermalis]
MGEQLIGIHSLLATIVSSVFLLLALMDKDELENFAFNNALKISSVVNVIALLVYSLYSISLGHKNIDINVIFYSIEAISIVTLLLYYIDLKGFNLKVKIENEKFINILTYSSITISTLATISMLFEFKTFENTIGFIRYDELILFINAIFFTLIIPLLPKRKKLNLEEYKKEKKEIDKKFKMMYLVYIVIMVFVIIYIALKK